VILEAKVPSLKDGSRAISKITTLDFYSLTGLVFWQNVCFNVGNGKNQRGHC
jgi:hypothetical protein